MLETASDRLDAYRFFHSKKPWYVTQRDIWFGLAGYVIPAPQNMAAMVVKLSAYMRTVESKRRGQSAPTPL